MASDSSSLVVAIFTALGTIVGYLGGEVASASVFNRILWPERYYNTSRPYAFLWIGALMPMGGPIHKSAVEAMDQLVELGLLKDPLRGAMLGSVFYKNTGHLYVAHTNGFFTEELKSARNALWITVMELVAGRTGHQLSSSSCPSGRHGESRKRKRDVKQRLPFMTLKLRRDDETEPVPSTLVTGDIGPLRLRYFGGIVASEAISIIFGVATAVYWKTPFAAWYFVPLLLKVIALLCRVRRQAGKGTEQFEPSQDGEPTLFNVQDKSKGFFVITGPRQVVYQFFHHYGHPLRSNPASEEKESAGFKPAMAGDRIRELISMFCVLAFIFVYPVGLIVFLFTTTDVQWVWLGYELVMMISMHAYRYLGGENCGTTQEWLAIELTRNLANKKLPVCFDDGSGHRLIVELDIEEVDGVKEGREKLSACIDDFFRNPELAA